MMTLLDIAVFMGLPRLNLPPFHVVIAQQCLIAPLKIRRDGEIVHGRRHSIRAMQQWHATQLPQRSLQAFTQAGEALGKADRAGFPVRIRQHEVIQQMGESFPGNENAHIRQMREVAFARFAGPMLLREVHFLCRPFRRPPVFYFPLQGPELTICESLRMLALQRRENRLGLQARIGP